MSKKNEYNLIVKLAITQELKAGQSSRVEVAFWGLDWDCRRIRTFINKTKNKIKKSGPAFKMSISGK